MEAIVYIFSLQMEAIAGFTLSVAVRVISAGIISYKEAKLQGFIIPF